MGYFLQDQLLANHIACITKIIAAASSDSVYSNILLLW